MRRAAILLTLSLALVSTGCHTTPGGRAIDARLGSAFGGFWRSPFDVLEGEYLRGRRLLQRRWSPAGRLPGLVRQLGDIGATTAARLQALPGTMVRGTANVGANVASTVRRLGTGESELQRQLGPGAMIHRWRKGWPGVAEWLDWRRPFLPGPGDPDRSIDPGQTARGETLVERLLRRF